MYIRNEEFEIENEKQLTQNQEPMETIEHTIRQCQMCSSCPYVATCSMVNGNIGMPNSALESNIDGMTRQYDFNRPPKYQYIKHPGMHHMGKPHSGMYHHSYYHPYHNPFYPSFFAPHNIAPWLIGSMLFGNQDNDYYDDDDYYEDDDD